jgi:hypothetical protein
MVPGPHPNAYDLIGETPTVSELVNTLGTALNRPIRYVEITDEQWAAAVKDRINPHGLNHLSDLWRFFRTSGMGRGENGLHVSDAIRSLTGTPPLSLEQFFRRNTDALTGPGVTGVIGSVRR